MFSLVVIGLNVDLSGRPALETLEDLQRVAFDPERPAHIVGRSVGDQEICLQFVFVADQLAKTLAVESDCPRFLDVRLGERKSARGAAALVIEFKIQLLGISLFWKRCPFLWFTVTQVNHAWLNCDGRLVFTFSECCPAKS